MRVAAVFAGIPLATAVPAWADASLNGTYYLVWNDGDQSTWVITSTCDSPDSCVAHIASGSSNGGSTVGGEAQLANGRWSMAIDKPDGAACADGSRAPQHNEYSWDAATLSGTLVASAGPICGERAPKSATFTFTMSKVG
jgi:hypothetical protein